MIPFGPAIMILLALLIAHTALQITLEFPTAWTRRWGKISSCLFYSTLLLIGGAYELVLHGLSLQQSLSIISVGVILLVCNLSFRSISNERLLTLEVLAVAGWVPYYLAW